MQQNNDDLLDRFRSTSEKVLERVIPSVDKLNPEDFESATRANTHRLNQSWVDLKSFLHKSLKWTVVLLLLVFFLILSRYVYDVISSTEETKLLLKEIWNTILIAAATLFIQFAISRKG